MARRDVFSGDFDALDRFVLRDVPNKPVGVGDGDGITWLDGKAIEGSFNWKFACKFCSIVCSC